MNRIKAIVVDVDGTISNDFWRKHTYTHKDRDWDTVNAMSKYDIPFLWCQELVNAMAAQGYHIVFLTARNDTAKEVTDRWLLSNIGPNVQYSLVMRVPGDNRDDWMYKEEAYKLHVEPYYDILFAVDNNQDVADMWLRLGVPCLKCDGITL